MSEICTLLRKSNHVSISIQVLIFVFILISGSFWLLGNSKTDVEEEKEWKNKAYNTFVIGTIVVCFLYTVNSIFYERSFHQKCSQTEQFLKLQMDSFNKFKQDILEQLTFKNLANNIVQKASRALTDAVKNGVTNGVNNGINSGMNS